MNGDADDVEVVAEGRRFSLLRDDEGYAIWDDRSDDEEPIVEFPLTDEGVDDAFDALARLRGRARRDLGMGIAAWVVVTFGVLWLVYVTLIVVHHRGRCLHRSLDAHAFEAGSRLTRRSDGSIIDLARATVWSPAGFAA